MPQQVYPTAIEKAYAALKEQKGKLDIKPMEKGTDEDVQGLYNLPTGIIRLGTYEKTTPRVLWHEQMHKFLREDFGLKETIQWDNIANSLEEFLFPEEKMPHHEVNYATALKEKSKEFKNKELVDLLKQSFR